jgi:hypothetical protein
MVSKLSREKYAIFHKSFALMMARGGDKKGRAHSEAIFHCWTPWHDSPSASGIIAPKYIKRRVIARGVSNSRLKMADLLEKAVAFTL